MEFSRPVRRAPWHAHTFDRSAQRAQVMFDGGMAGLMPHARGTRLEAWSTSELEDTLQMLHQHMDMVRFEAVVAPLLLLLPLPPLPAGWLLHIDGARLCAMRTFGRCCSNCPASSCTCLLF